MTSPQGAIAYIPPHMTWPTALFEFADDARTCPMARKTVVGAVNPHWRYVPRITASGMAVWLSALPLMDTRLLGADRAGKSLRAVEEVRTGSCLVGPAWLSRSVGVRVDGGAAESCGVARLFRRPSCHH